jgi:signal transduction histidine kinase/NAD-dependent dihydropyrimidine dehydrogenase PreA subunit
MGVVSTIPEKCRRCYTCVRECPAKAIKVEAGQAMVIEERCITCGNCVKVCAQKAKRIEDDTAEVRRLIASGRRTFACLAPSFPAGFHPARPGQVVHALRRLGFAEVWEVAFGAELVSRAYAALFEKARRNQDRVITTPCPAIVGFVEKYMAPLIGSLAPIVSPMVATARAVRQRHGPEAAVVFIGPCIAKKTERRDPAVAGVVDAVLTYEEVGRMFGEAGISLAEQPDADPDGPWCGLGRSFAISGGLLRTAGLSMDILENEVVITEGKDRVLEALQELARGRSCARLFDVLFCEGCVNGPTMLNDLSVFARKEIVAAFAQQRSRAVGERRQREALEEFAGLDLSRRFQAQDLALPQPTEEQIAAALLAMRKFAPGDQLNCGACGYRSCREKAVAVCQGLAEPEMCLPYLVDELQATCERLEHSHEDLASAQQRLVQAERLASMGQLAAGVAHEINNPLGSVLIYSHMLLRELSAKDAQRRDIEMIVSEATRCKNIVRGLLDFARQSRVSKTATDLGRLVQEVMDIMRPKAEGAGARLVAEVPADMPEVCLDGNQIKQVLVNLVDNGIDALTGPGEVRVEARMADSGERVVMRVSDTGVGIPPENVSRLFTPFFTTKEMGKGTGLGLAIAYGVVKMHSGDIGVDSAPGRGTTFTINLPARDKAATPVVR